ncbi:MAG: Rrf2 family transcriptional regulator [Candidatus Sumerlaeota bacterium]|nr:Rrf2 family transcriptional regulator [Candidatus Sumerlaeota bacterium]
MKLSTRARYALRSMVAISRLSDGGSPVSLHEVAKAIRVSRRYLDLLCIALRNASLLKSTPGRRGGYRLARPAKDIRVGQIVEASIGPINIVECVGHPEACLLTDTCECRLLYSLINNRIRDVLYDYSLADLSDKSWVVEMRRRLAGKGKS